MDRTNHHTMGAICLQHTCIAADASGIPVQGQRLRLERTWGLLQAALLAALLCLSAMLSGCGSGGYAGGGIASVSASVITLDATQSMTVSANVAGNLPVSWTLSGAACSAAGCGTLSSAAGAQTTYTAPATVTAPFQVTLQAQINGTTSARTVTINVNPAPVILGTPPSGVVGTPYSFTFTTSGGTSPKKLGLLSGSLPAGLTFNATTGVVSGTPTAAGTSAFTLQLVDGSDVPFTVTASKSITINATAPTPTVTVTGNPPAGTVGTAYSTTLQATGGTSPYAWSIASGALPAGLTLNASTGVISGTPTASGTFTFSAQARDAAGNTGTGAFTVVVGSGSTGTGLTISTGTLPNGTVGTAYTATVGVTGGTSPYTCALVSGTLPAGLTLSANCAVTGTPTTAGTSTVTVRATDSASPAQTATGSVSITISPATLTLAAGTLPNGTVGTAYSATLGVTGGTAPYTCAVAGGTVPAGLTLNANCTVTGTPTTAGTIAVNVQVTDSSSPAQTITSTQAITIGNAPTLTLTPPVAATVNTPYTGTVGVTGGTSPYTCAVTGGALPAGLVLNANCTLTGTPTAAGTSTVTVKATDSGSPAITGTSTFNVTVNPAGLGLASSTLPNGTVNTPYTGTIPVTGGTSPYSCMLTAGAVPAGLTLNTNCTVTGTPTTAGTTTAQVTVTDSSSPAKTESGPVTLTINPAAVTITTGTLPGGTVNTPYTATVGIAGGTSPYTCAVTNGTLPAGLTLNANCTVTGTPTTVGTATVTVRATDSANPAQTGSGPVSVTISPAALAVTGGTLPSCTVGVACTSTVPVTGGSSPYTCAVTSGTLPAGLTMGANCTITGTPTTPGTSTVTVGVTDSGNPPQTGSGTYTITVNPAALGLASSTLPNGTVGVAYSATVGIMGGTSPYACQLVSGTLPAGLALDANCSVAGTPTAAGTVTVSVKTTDASNPAQTVTGPQTITINPASLDIGAGSLPSGTVNTPYTATLPITGGTSPYSCTVTSGSLPAGLALGANCTVTGTPTTPGTTTATVSVTDSGNPVQTASGNVSITINPAPVTLTTGSLPTGTVNTPYTGTIAVSGGTSPYTCSLVSGTLHAGLALNANCTVTGTPTAAGTVTLQVRATDSASPAQSGTGAVSLTINPATLALSTGTLPNGTVGTPYSATVGVTGGTSPYTCTLVNGTLPTGLALNANCTVTGTPTAAGTSSVSVKATDSGSPAQTVTGPQTITIAAAPATLIPANPPAATVNTPYTGTIPVTGGTSPYTCTITSGSLPAGLALGANCALSGTPTTAGSSTVTVSATDSSTPANTGSGPVTVTVNGPAATLTVGNPATATVSTPYTGTIPVTGGTAPYSCTITSGTLPAGLSLGANCALSGTPTTAGSATVAVSATDGSSPIKTGSGPSTITVQPVPALTFTGSLPNGVVNQPYSQTLQASGGVGPYTYAVTSGTLPAGITLSSSGVVSGTPTAVGASAFTVTATDSEGTPQTANLPLTLLITYGSNSNSALLKGQYAFLFQGYDDVALGVLAYQTATAGSLNADGNGAITAGEQDSNGQGSNPSGPTVATRNLLGTYTIGNDRRGSLTLTSFNTDGSVFRTQTYAIALKAPVSPATSSAQGSFLQFDNANLAGTRGSGTLLQQSGTAIAAGLSGSYAFGMQGDTPCLPSCTIGIAAGPVASVGQFTAAGGSITGGTEDANIGAVNYPSTALSGSYTAADMNGRVALTLNNASLPSGIFPNDYAAYVVDANRVLLVSRDKHFSYILQAGTATLQTQSTFSTSTSLNGPFVGYENAPVNPGLVSVALQQVLNLQTATVFSATANGGGNCTTTHVDSAGLTGIVNSLGGLINAPVVSALIGTYQERGNSSCTAAGNGRAVLNYPPPDSVLTTTLTLLGLPVVAPAPRVAYLTAPNQGYFLETSYAGLGMIEAQSGSPFSNASLNGTYVYGSIPASSLATLNSSGAFTADGAGNDSFLLDKNVGVGNINVLQLGVASSGTYTIRDTTAGRFELSTGEVIYEIVPGRFVLLEPPVLNLNPYVALLY